MSTSAGRAVAAAEHLDRPADHVAVQGGARVRDLEQLVEQPADELDLGRRAAHRDDVAPGVDVRLRESRPRRHAAPRHRARAAPGRGARGARSGARRRGRRRTRARPDRCAGGTVGGSTRWCGHGCGRTASDLLGCGASILGGRPRPSPCARRSGGGPAEPCAGQDVRVHVEHRLAGVGAGVEDQPELPVGEAPRRPRWRPHQRPRAAPGSRRRAGRRRAWWSRVTTRTCTGAWGLMSRKAMTESVCDHDVGRYLPRDDPAEQAVGCGQRGGRRHAARLARRRVLAAGPSGNPPATQPLADQRGGHGPGRRGAHHVRAEPDRPPPAADERPSSSASSMPPSGPTTSSTSPDVGQRRRRRAGVARTRAARAPRLRRRRSSATRADQLGRWSAPRATSGCHARRDCLVAERTVASHFARLRAARSPRHTTTDRWACHGTMPSTPTSVAASIASSSRSPLASAWTSTTRTGGGGSDDPLA